MISSFRWCVRNTCQKNIRAYFYNMRNKDKCRESRMLNRMLEKGMKKKKNSSPQTGSLLKQSLWVDDNNGTRNKQNAALNKVYMECLTELIQSGKHSAKLLENGFEITRIEITKKGEHLNILYTCSNENLTDEAIAEMLITATKELQEQMGNIRFIARPPFLRFMRDVKMEKAQTVERLLKIADFGDDFQPIHPDNVITQDCNMSDDGLPVMRHDVLGVNHAEIKSKILTAMEIYKVTYTPKENEFAYVEMENLIPFDKKTFAKFYKRKRILDRKLTSRGLFGWRRSNTVENEEEDEDDDYMNEFLDAIKKEQEEEEKEYARE